MRAAAFALSLGLLALPLPPFSRARGIAIFRRLEALRVQPAVEEGTTLEAAVIVPVSSEEALRGYENDWIFKYYGRFRRTGGGIGGKDGRHYEVVKVELADHSERTFYFDITKATAKAPSN